MIWVAMGINLNWGDCKISKKLKVPALAIQIQFVLATRMHLSLRNQKRPK